MWKDANDTRYRCLPANRMVGPLKTFCFSTGHELLQVDDRDHDYLPR